MTMSEVAIRDSDELVIEAVDSWSLRVRGWLLTYDSENTRKAYARDIEQWTDFCASKGIDPLTVRRVVLDAWKADLATTGGHNGRPASPKTINRKLSSVASLYTYLVHEEEIEQSPAAHIKRPRVGGDYQSTAALDEDQASRLLVAAEELGTLESAAVRILMFSGVRAAELLSADDADVLVGHGRVRLRVTRKGGKIQEIPLSPETGSFLLDYLGDRPDGPILRTDAGARLEYWPLYHLVAKAGRRAKVDFVVTPHVLRATFGTTYLNEPGAQIDRLQDIFGHVNTATTKLYDRGAASIERMASVMGIVEKRIAAARTGRQEAS